MLGSNVDYSCRKYIKLFKQYLFQSCCNRWELCWWHSIPPHSDHPRRFLLILALYTVWYDRELMLRFIHIWLNSTHIFSRTLSTWCLPNTLGKLPLIFLLVEEASHVMKRSTSNKLDLCLHKTTITSFDDLQIYSFSVLKGYSISFCNDKAESGQHSAMQTKWLHTD